SPAVAAVARELGVDTAFTSWRSNTHVPRWLSPAAAIDDGKRIAEAMGLRAWYLDRPRPRITEDELFFLAASTPPLALVFPAMAPWRIGGDYDRPIPRRLAESAGVPRPWFGLKKKAVVITYAYPIHRGLRRDFGEYVRRHFGYPPAFVVWHALVNKVAFVVV